MFSSLLVTTRLGRTTSRRLVGASFLASLTIGSDLNLGKGDLRTRSLRGMKGLESIICLEQVDLDLLIEEGFNLCEFLG